MFGFTRGGGRAPGAASAAAPVHRRKIHKVGKTLIDRYRPG